MACLFSAARRLRSSSASRLRGLKRRLEELDDPSYVFYPVYTDLQGITEEYFFATLAEDAFQLTWLKLSRAIHTIREPERLPGWLKVTAHNEAVSLVRNNWRLICSDAIEEAASEGDRSDGSLTARFTYAGSTCSNLGHPLTSELTVELSPADADDRRRINATSCRPAENDLGVTKMCSCLRDPERFARQARRLKTLTTAAANPALRHVLEVQARVREAAQGLAAVAARAPRLEVEFPRSGIGSWPGTSSACSPPNSISV